MIKKSICILLMLALIVPLFACTKDASSETQNTSESSKPLNLMADRVASSVTAQEATDSHSVAAANFAMNLLKNTYSGENCILSPLSVYSALAMTANGADGETLRQMQEVLGMSAAELNVYLYALAQNPSENLTVANSIWFRQEDGFTPNEEFLQINADFYGADLFAAPFNDQTVQDVNAWISEKTNGKITEMLDRIDPNTMMYLINALSFDAEWLMPYDEYQLVDAVFHGTNGEEDAVLMHSEEAYYLDDGSAIGFKKPYAGDRYSFVALLPHGDLTEYIDNLSGETLLSTVKNASQETVFAAMPKYEIEYSALLNDSLIAMGMPDAFSNEADFSRMSNYDLLISMILHKTFFKVDEAGTQAGAATIVAVSTKGAVFNAKSVTLDRPFLMGIYDEINECFVFLGTVNSVAN